MANINVDGNTNPDLFVENPLLQKKDIRKIDRVYKSLASVLMDYELNVRRAMDHSHIAAVSDSMERGILFTEFLPIIEKLPKEQIGDDGQKKTHILIDGYNRVSALQKIGYTHYWFDVAEFGDEDNDPRLSRVTCALASNLHPPKLSSTDNDVFSSVVSAVMDKLIEKDPIAIKEYIRKYGVSGRGSAARAAKIASEVMAATGVEASFQLWTAPRIKNEIDFFGLTSSGSIDAKRQLHGWTCLESYEADTVMNALGKLRDTGKCSYIIGHVKQPNTEANLLDKREKMKLDIERRKEALVAFVEYYNEHKDFPFELLGYLPQQRSEAKHKFVAV